MTTPERAVKLQVGEPGAESSGVEWRLAMLIDDSYAPVWRRESLPYPWRHGTGLARISTDAILPINPVFAIVATVMPVAMS